jgi:16S rRNA A1518/A1519 N6-dimethyltransferase RsmA/KsgA/DIM1 with predicted DNA glycosylase/AP lyase activity
MWVPSDETIYLDVLDRIEPHDIILDIGAGDLRLARRMAMTCRWLYALEI